METVIEPVGGAADAAALSCGWPSGNEQAAAGIVNLPLDARQWVDPCTLTLWVQDVVEALSSARHDPSGNTASASVTRMFQILTFAYATNTLASDEIAAACKSEPAFRFLSGGEAPFPEELTAFRRRHRLQLHSLLTRVLAWVARTRIEDACPCLYSRFSEAARERLDIARHLDEV